MYAIRSYYVALGHAGVDRAVYRYDRRQGALAEARDGPNGEEPVVGREGRLLVLPELGHAEPGRGLAEQVERSARVAGGTAADDYRVLSLRLQVEERIERGDRVDPG